MEYNNTNISIEVLKAFFRSVDQGILFFDGNMRFLYANKKAVSLLGGKSQEEAGGILKENCPDEVFLNCKKGKSNSTFIELKDSSGEGRKLLGVEFALNDPPGIDPLFCALIHDFSNWEKLDRMRSDFISSVSHRLRTPMTSVQNSLELLNMKNKTISVKDRGALLEIGMRNIKRLSSSLSELQKIFMVESEEMNIIRSLVRIEEETADILKGLDSNGVISGFELTGCNIAVFIGRSKLESYITTVLGLFRNWIGTVPHIFAELNLQKSGDIRAKAGRLEISLKPEGVSPRDITLKDFLYFKESHRSILMEKLAGALGGEININGEKVTVSIPVNPEFDREKDLVHPLHYIVEQSRIEKKRFCLVNLKLACRVKDMERKNELLKNSLCEIRTMGKDCFVVMDEEPFSYLIFILDHSKDEIEEMINSAVDRLEESGRKGAFKGKPDVSWDIKFQSSMEKDSDFNLLKAKELV